MEGDQRPRRGPCRRNPSDRQAREVPTGSLKPYFSTTSDRATGEYLALDQLAEAAGGEAGSDVPEEGILCYVVNLNIRLGVEDFARLRTRRGPTVFLVGVLRGWDEADLWRPYFEELKRSGDLFVVHHPAQVRYLETYGIRALLLPLHETRYAGAARPRPGTVLYTGFYWHEKDLRMVEAVARLLPSWRFTIQIGMNVSFDPATLPPNLEIRGGFLEPAAYADFLPTFEIIWIPRKPSSWVYAGRSALSAVASGRPVLLTDVLPHETIPPGAAIKYPPDWNAERIAELLASRPLPDANAVERCLAEADPRAVWERLASALAETRKDFFPSDA